MEGSIDPATSSLLCLETNDTCFDEFEYNVADESPFWDRKNLNFGNHSLIKDNNGSEHLLDFPVQSDETVLGLFVREREHLPQDDYPKRLLGGDLDLSVRKEALDWIWKAHAYYDFGPCSLCLSVNYLDRFLSVYELPRGKSWSVQLLAVACLSIAAKMEEAKVPSCLDLQVGDPKFVFEAKTIQRMELLVLSILRWKMLALTPFSFLEYFLRKIICDPLLVKSSFLRSIRLIFDMIRCINFLEFRPSEIAAAVAISVSRELQVEEIEKVLTCVIVEKERILKCLELIRDLSLIQDSANLGSNLTPFVPLSPMGVLDAPCLSCTTSDELTVGSYTDSSLNTPSSKRRRFD